MALIIWEITKRPNAQDIVQEETWMSNKKDTGWKIVFPEKGVVREATRKTSDGKEIKINVLQSREVEPKQSALMQKMMASAAHLLGELTKEVRAGRYKTRKEAEAALKSTQARLLKE